VVVEVEQAGVEIIQPHQSDRRALFVLAQRGCRRATTSSPVAKYAVAANLRALYLIPKALSPLALLAGVFSCAAKEDTARKAAEVRPRSIHEASHDACA
jgi:hypothetical protein